VYAGIILHIIKYVEWGDSKNKLVKIGIVNDAKLVQSLNKILLGKNLQFKNIEVNKLEDVSYIDDINVLFLEKKSANLCSKISNLACDKNMLVITEMKSPGTVCPSINFTEEQGKLKFEIYLAVAEKCGLMISEQLKKYAILK
jgi:hypothetical protein